MQGKEYICKMESTTFNFNYNTQLRKGKIIIMFQTWSLYSKDTLLRVHILTNKDWKK